MVRVFHGSRSNGGDFHSYILRGQAMNTAKEADDGLLPCPFCGDAVRMENMAQMERFEKDGCKDPFLYRFPSHDPTAYLAILYVSFNPPSTRSGDGVRVFQILITFVSPKSFRNIRCCLTLQVNRYKNGSLHPFFSNLSI